MKYFLVLPLMALASTGFATDHNNLESGRPLLFDDAYSIAYGEREFQTGLQLASGHSGLMTSFGYGFAKNQDLSIAWDANTKTTYNLSYFRNLSREFEHSPALGFRISTSATKGQMASAQLRFAATKAWHQFDKVHLNFDFDTSQVPRFILGYSNPVGYPKKFDQTLLAEFAFQDHQTSIGVGVRQQIDPRSVLDIGLRIGNQTQLVVGYSLGF
jgi:hypothetical protein